MSFRNFSHRDVKIEIQQHARFESMMVVHLSSEVKAELIEALKEVVDGKTNELRVDLPNQMTLFFKVREGDSRILVARPETDILVGTLALLKNHMDLLISQLSVPEVSIDITKVASVHRLSNLEVRFIA